MAAVRWVWHVHHEYLLEPLRSLEDRRRAIRETKPWNEEATRLRLLNPVRGQLPQKFLAACRRRVLEVRGSPSLYQLFGSEVAQAAVLSGSVQALKALHKKECGCKAWRGVRGQIYGNTKFLAESLP